MRKNFKFQISNFKSNLNFKKIVICHLDFVIYLSFVIWILSFLSLQPVYALESTPSADIKTKLEELKKEIASKAAKLKQEVNKKLQNKAYIGKLNSKSQTTLTLATKNGPKLVNINQDTEFTTKVKAKKFSQKLLSEEDYLAALGDVDENGVLTAKKIVLLSPVTYNLRTFLWGQIIAISDKLVTLKDKLGKNAAISAPNQSQVKLNDFVILTGTFNTNEIFEAEFVYIIPQGGILKPKKTATQSAQTATHSASSGQAKSAK